MKASEIMRHPLKAAANDWHDRTTPIIKPIAWAIALSVVAIILAIWLGFELGKSG